MRATPLAQNVSRDRLRVSPRPSIHAQLDGASHQRRHLLVGRRGCNIDPGRDGSHRSVHDLPVVTDDVSELKRGLVDSFEVTGRELVGAREHSCQSRVSLRQRVSRPESVCRTRVVVHSVLLDRRTHRPRSAVRPATCPAQARCIPVTRSCGRSSNAGPHSNVPRTSHTPATSPTRIDRPTATTLVELHQRRTHAH
jgi:hypothetical protein